MLHINKIMMSQNYSVMQRLHFIVMISFLCLLLLFKNKLTDLKLVIEDTIDNVATLQDCSVDQGESVQLLGENRLQPTVSHNMSCACCHFNLILDVLPIIFLSC